MTFVVADSSKPEDEI